jgi:hypothetical protein
MSALLIPRWTINGFAGVIIMEDASINARTGVRPTPHHGLGEVEMKVHLVRHTALAKAKER